VLDSSGEESLEGFGDDSGVGESTSGAIGIPGVIDHERRRCWRVALLFSIVGRATEPSLSIRSIIWGSRSTQNDDFYNYSYDDSSDNVKLGHGITDSTPYASANGLA
jgi:hypothetical protein